MFTRNSIRLSLILVSLLLLCAVIHSQETEKNPTKSADTLTIGISGKLSTLNPIKSYVVDSNSEAIRPLMYNSLVKRNKNLEYVGELAKEINFLNNGKIIEFILYDNIPFQNTEVLTSADVKYTLETLLASEWAKSAMFYESLGDKRKSIISNIKTPDSRTVQLFINKSSNINPILNYLTTIPIVAKDSISLADDKILPIGTGAYKFVKFDDKQGILELKANKNYWQGVPSISNLQIKLIVEKKDIIAGIKSNKLDIFIDSYDFTLEEIEKFKPDKDVKLNFQTDNSIQCLTFNTQIYPLNNKKVRQAIAYAIDRESMIDNLLNGNAEIAHSILPKESWAYSSGTKYNFDQTKAKNLLREAGFKDENNDGMFDVKPIVITVSSYSQETINVAENIKNHLTKIGLPIKVEPDEFQTIISQVQSGEYQLYIGRWVGGNQDPRFLHDLFASSEIPNNRRASRNRSRYENKKVDDLLNSAMQELDASKAKLFYQDAQDIISEDMPLLPLWYPSYLIISNQKVYGDFNNSKRDFTFVKDLIKLP